ncbi:MAG: type II secretion system F family protein [Magnetococcales bacterium]|nr:type II secretion system F family protein [Magnetococcales bacterium]
MPHMKYTAVDPKGKISRGWMDVSTVDALELRLAHLNLLLVQVHDGESRRDVVRRLLLERNAVSRKTLILFCIHMGQLIHAGVAIPVALEEVRASIPQPGFNTVLASMVEDIQSGKHFSTAVQSHPHCFPPLFGSLIQVGERTGRLEEIFADLADSLKWEEELLSQTRKALRYPLFVGAVVVALFFFLMIYLAPRLLSFLPQMGATLPFHTRLLIGLSQFVIQWWPVLLLVPVLAYGGVRLASHFSPHFRRQWDRWLLRIWFFGPLMRKIHLVRFAHVLALMYRSGVSILDAMASTAALSGNKAMQQAIEQAHQMVLEGAAVSDSFQRTRLFPAPLPRLLQVGEAAGQLDEALRNAGYFLDQEVRESIGQIQSLLEPILTLFVGSLLAWVILSVLGPIYDVITHVRF